MLTGDKMKKRIFFLIIFILAVINFNAYGVNNSINDAIDKIPTNDLEQYLNNNNSYFRDKNIRLTDLIKNAFKGRLDINLKDYFFYEMKKEHGFFKNILKTCIQVLVICMILTIINYFSDEISDHSVSEIVIFFSVLVIFTIIFKDVLSLKELIEHDFTKFKSITEEVNAIFLAAMLTFGKLSILQFFQTSLNYIIGVTTQLIFSVTDMATVIMIAVILINNMSKLINAEMLYKFLKKGTLLILSGYIIIVVINFSVQGYILYKTDNIFINSIKALSPSSIPFIGNAVTSFFGVFLKSILLIKDVLGVVVIIFVLSAFGGSLLKIFLAFALYKATAVISEPFNKKISKMIYEMADIFYIYFICMLTPIIIVTVYYSVLLNYMNNIFG